MLPESPPSASIVIDSSGVVVAADGQTRAIYQSTDHGDSWPRHESDVDRAFHLLGCDRSGIVYAATGWDGIYRASIGRYEWSLIYPNGISDRSFRVTMTGCGEMFLVNADTIRHSSNQGSTWRPISSCPRHILERGVSLDNRVIDAADSLLFSITATGMFRSSDQGASWAFVDTLPTCRIIERPDGTLLRSIGFPHRRWWQPPATGLLRSTDRGATWQTIRSDALYYLVPIGDSLLFASTPHGISRSADEGRIWSPVNRGLRDFSVAALAVAPNGTIAAGVGQRVAVSSDGGSSWSIGSATFEPWVESIEFSPQGELVLGTSGAREDTGSFIMRSTDLGANWKHLLTVSGDGVDQIVTGLRRIA